MPRSRNIFDYSTEDSVHRPKAWLVDVPVNDSVNEITIEFEGSGFVQIVKVNNDNDRPEWQVITSFEINKQKKGTVSYVR